MESLIEISNKFEIEIMPRKELSRTEYLACWEIYNSQPWSGGAYSTTAQFIYRAMSIVSDAALIEWVKSNARFLAQNNYHPTLNNHIAQWEKIQAWIT